MANGYEIDRAEMDDKSKEINKICGKVKVMKKVKIGGIYKTVNAYRKVRWDAHGHCYGITTNRRLRDYDLPLKDFVNHK